MATKNPTTPFAAIDRETASKINPFISRLWTEETLDSLSELVTDMGCYVSANEDSPGPLTMRSMYLVFGAIGAALKYEAANMSLRGPGAGIPAQADGA